MYGKKNFTEEQLPFSFGNLLQHFDLQTHLFYFLICFVIDRGRGGRGGFGGRGGRDGGGGGNEIDQN